MNLFWELYKLRRLSVRRHPMFEKSRFATFFVGIGICVTVGCLIFYGVGAAIAFKDEPVEPYHIIDSGFVVLLIIDFLMRIGFCKTPTQEIKPFLMLPIKRGKLIDFLLLRTAMDGTNLLWLAFYLPFALLCITKFYGLIGVLGYCLGVWLLIVMNAYWFLLCKTLLNQHMAWCLLPLLAYAGCIALTVALPQGSVAKAQMMLGDGFMQWQWWAFGIVLLLIALLWVMNHYVTARVMYKELNKVADTRVKHVSEYHFLDRYGTVGEYMKLELKLQLRNKTCRSQLIYIVLLVLFFSLMLSFDIYGHVGTDFIVVYNYAICGLLFLGNMLSLEGNYMDGLMTRKESVYSLLRAKYNLYGVLSVVPTLLMTPAMISGNVSLLTCVAWQAFTAGVIYFLLFQYAVYNNYTIPLNAKMTNRKNMGTAMQNIIQIGVFALPLILNYALKAFLSERAALLVIMVLGLAFIATNPIWLKNIYYRILARKYVNMQGFRDSKEKSTL